MPLRATESNTHIPADWGVGSKNARKYENVDDAKPRLIYPSIARLAQLYRKPDD
jgi:hypothetical protein